MQKIKKLTPKVLDLMGSMQPFTFSKGLLILEQWCKDNKKKAVIHKKANGDSLCYIRSTGRICKKSIYWYALTIRQTGRNNENRKRT